jgi:hypothetical protein
MNDPLTVAAIRAADDMSPSATEHADRRQASEYLSDGSGTELRATVDEYETSA